jgi:hypothetical protein
VFVGTQPRVKKQTNGETSSKVADMKQLVKMIFARTTRALGSTVHGDSSMMRRLACCIAVATIALSSQALAQQCNDGIDNDADGKIDALVELNPANGARITIGGAGDPPAVRAAIDAAIVAKKFPYARPTSNNIVRSDRASWSNTGRTDTGVQDITTLSRVCRILGYRDYVSSTCRDGERSSRYPNGKCNYHSPENNVLWRFRNNTFVAESATPKYGKTWIATITCVNKLPACSDGWDNDGDGLVDRADGGCASDNDNSEVAHDTTCTTPTGPSEFETTQCSDGIDNDQDGAVDYPADFSCSSRTDNDETNPKSQCQDGIDNDGDGLTDLHDPGCPNRQGNNESSATTQCQDGIDNDGDGAKDYPADFSCSSRTDNDETNPKSQCQDGIDNDGDGLTDLKDPGCPNNQGNNEAAGTPQCQDGIDNDGDGAKDYPADFSCSSPTDHDETNPKSQCQDGIDNDGDGLTDLKDPGCPNNQGNNEAAGTPQCQDGIDNDGDGAKDYPADFSCSSPTDHDETNPKSQCQDGIDNDGDGLTDLSDPGCPNNQGNNEGCATTQCQDGIDNDGDGATDYPADFSCSSPTDNDETNPKAQCQDGLDNDGDGFTDLKDPGCKTNQGNNEGSGTTQCQDGIDNDGDGATDFGADYSCSSPADNDETNPKSQCQDGIDNDGDGFIDLKDPGCPTSQGNNEANSTSQCQNKQDDDGDGLIDLLDPGCTNPTDPDESNSSTQCQDKVDNDGDGFIDYPQDKGCSSATDNDETDAPTACKDKLDNDGDGLIDYPADPGCSNAEDTDESNTTSPRITPIAECVDVNADGSIAARFGYINESPVSSAVPVGTLNYFTPGSQNRGQPEAFLPGRASNVLTVTIPAGQSVSWVVGQSTATANSSTTRCQSNILGCIDTDNMPTLSILDRIARTQRTNILRITQRVTKRKTSGSTAQQAEKLSTQAKALYLEQWTDIWGSFPQISTACTGCASVDISSEVQGVLSRAQRLNRIARQAAALLRTARRGKLSADERGLISASGQIYDQFVQATQTLPRFTSSCK